MFPFMTCSRNNCVSSCFKEIPGLQCTHLLLDHSELPGGRINGAVLRKFSDYFHTRNKRERNLTHIPKHSYIQTK